MARIAARTDEAVREDSASEVLTELVLHVARERCAVALTGVHQERLEVVANERVQHRLGWASRPIRAGEHGHERRRERVSCQTCRSGVSQGSE